MPLRTGLAVTSLHRTTLHRTRLHNAGLQRTGLQRTGQARAWRLTWVLSVLGLTLLRQALLACRLPSATRLAKSGRLTRLDRHCLGLC